MSKPGSPDDRTTAFERWELIDLAVSQPQPDARIQDASAIFDDARQADAQFQIQAALEEARRLGWEEGREQGLLAGQAEAAQDCARMKQLADSFASMLDSLDFRLADMVLELALDVARQVVAGELTARPERILDVVNLALKQMAESARESRLLLNPEDAALVRPRLEQVLDKSRLRIVEDVRMVRGGCRIETTQGDLDATLPARWRQVVQVLGSNTGWMDD
jgi:flagellar assembly protein FliH